MILRTTGQLSASCQPETAGNWCSYIQHKGSVVPTITNQEIGKKHGLPQYERALPGIIIGKVVFQAFIVVEERSQHC